MGAKAIIITGTPGTGKTAISSYLNRVHGIPTINLGELCIQHNLILEEDSLRDTKVIDETKLILKLTEILMASVDPLLIVEGHYADIVPNDFIKAAVLLRTDPFILRERLIQRKYSENKILENIQAEILSDCGSFLKEKQLSVPILEYDTSKYEIAQIGEEIYEFLVENRDVLKNGVKKIERTKGIDWFSLYNEKMDQFFI